ncbi:MAG TPA: hypothetical protein VFP14_01235 [Novosphingobium sp.]|nr:hypothetical protein [Novosphingobium sp.]
MSATALPLTWWRLACRHQVGSLLLVLALLSLLAGLAPQSPPTMQPRFADSHTPGDQALYATVTAKVAAGASYYPTVVRLHRERGYPLRPFVTVRPPTLAVASAALGPAGTLALAIGLIAANAIAWYRRLCNEGPLLRLGALAGMSAMGAAGLSPDVLTAHEWWSGLLLSLALALGPERRFGPALACAVAAALVRELAVGFLLILFAVELAHRAWRRASVVAAALLVLAVMLVLHMNAVTALVTPHDMASPGWLDLRGPTGFARDFGILLGLDGMPLPLVVILAFTPLVGWLSARRAVGMMPLAWFGSFALIEGIVARADNWYWVQLILPAYLLGWLFLARAILPKFTNGAAGLAAGIQATR